MVYKIKYYYLNACKFNKVNFIFQKIFLSYFKIGLLINLYQLQCYLFIFFNFFYNFILTKHSNVQIKKKNYQVLKSPQIHKKAQEKYLVNLFSNDSYLYLKNFYLNKLYKHSLNNMFKFCIIRIFSNQIKFYKLTKKIRFRILL